MACLLYTNLAGRCRADVGHVSDSGKVWSERAVGYFVVYPSRIHD
jgi:hypothetical protein